MRLQRGMLLDWRTALGVGWLCVAGCQGVEPSASLLGEINFPNSGLAAAQPAFIEGVLYLHNFEYEQAAVSFRQAQDIDSTFALAYWGEAMTHHHTIWREHDQRAAEAVLLRLGATPEQRAAKAPTGRERGYLRAIEVLLGTDADAESGGGTLDERRVRYRIEMRRLHEAYPDDDEAAVLFALAILGEGRANRDFGTYMRAAGKLLAVWEANPMHPGAAHYLIHCFDDPTHAPLGLGMAVAYSKIAPAAAHAQHMTSHIFLGLGMWEPMVSANETALAIELEETEDWSREASHYVHWLHYGYLQQGRYEQADSLIQIARERLRSGASARERGYYGTLYARHLVETGAWGDEERWAAPSGIEIPSPNYYFARASAAIERGDLDEARRAARLVRAGGEGNPEVVLGEDVAEILQLELEAMLAYASGDESHALTLLTEASAREQAMPPRFGPPAVVKPATEMLADVLNRTGHAHEALAAYGDQLLRTPRRGQTLLGLARAARAVGDTAEAARATLELLEVWTSADPDVRGRAGGSDPEA